LVRARRSRQAKRTLTRSVTAFCMRSAKSFAGKQLSGWIAERRLFGADFSALSANPQKLKHFYQDGLGLPAYLLQTYVSSCKKLVSEGDTACLADASGWCEIREGIAFLIPSEEKSRVQISPGT